MADWLIEIAIRLVNTGLGAFVGFMFLGHRSRRLMSSLGIDDDSGSLAIVIGCALVGLIWGKQIWSRIDRVFETGWSRRK